ncbi:MAG TPA: FAD-binding oxidoreductase [Gaiellaceae bacterium]|nr:FAD-binding oxidoreductase [Gaiellaceae bacterium]
MDATTTSLVELLSGLKGAVVAPDDAHYEEARRVFYGKIDRRPAVIARPANAAEVGRVVSLARETGLELAVRSGGHSLAGHGVSEGGIVLDLSGLKALDIDVQSRTAWAETGLTAAEYTTAVGAHGLATGFGDTGSVGIGGLTLGGGVGFLVRKYGLTIDDLLAAEVVTAEGELLSVDAESRPDLFWAIRGGGGNFGVATRFHFRLRDVDTIVGGMLILPATPDVIASFVAEADAAPDELSAIANIMVAPPMPFLPPEAHGKLVVLALMCYAGDADAGERAMEPFRRLAEPVADMVRPMRYPEIYRLFAEEEGPGPDQEVARSLFVDAVDRDAAEGILDHLRASTAPMAVAQLRVLGGAMARVRPDATAFAHRARRVMVALGAVYERAEETAEHESWVSDLAASLGGEGVYVNFLGDEGEARVREAYPGATWDRLAAVKARYDPTNLFRLNQNVPPA